VNRSKLPSDLQKSIEGILVVDKPTEISSYDVIRVVKNRLSPKKIGHTGTLDPLATGVLPVAMNEATKVIPFLDERVKAYEGTLRLGVVTDSDDSAGKVVKETPLNGSVVNEDAIRRAFKRFVGSLKQVPPMFSAVKYHGTPLYELARRGIEVERPEREVEIFSLEIVGVDLPLVDFRVSCSKGTYVRTLARQLGDALHVGAHLYRLRRTKSGPFSLQQAITLKEFDRLVEGGGIVSRIIPLREALQNMPEIEIGGELGRRIRMGGQVWLRDLKGLQMPCLKGKERVKILHRGEIVAIAEAQVWKTDRTAQIPERAPLSLLRVFA
jgi:tRNA pseudouridine55 synthase